LSSAGGPLLTNAFGQTFGLGAGGVGGAGGAAVGGGGGLSGLMGTLANGLGSVGQGLQNFGMNVLDPTNSPPGQAVAQARMAGTTPSIGDALQHLMLQGLNAQVQQVFAPIGGIPGPRPMAPAALLPRGPQGFLGSL